MKSMSEFMLEIMRMNDEELIELLIAEVENRTTYICNTPRMQTTDWRVVDEYTDGIESIKAELFRRM